MRNSVFKFITLISFVLLINQATAMECSKVWVSPDKSIQHSAIEKLGPVLDKDCKNEKNPRPPINCVNKIKTNGEAKNQSLVFLSAITHADCTNLNDYCEWAKRSVRDLTPYYCKLKNEFESHSYRK